MRKLIFISTLVLCARVVFAQTTSTYLNAKQAAAFTSILKTAELCVVIENEKAPLDAALVEAVNNNWKTTKIKFMSLLEFNDKLRNNTLDTKNLYLYNTIFVSSYGLSYYSGYYLTNDPIKLRSTRKSAKAPPYLYFSIGTAVVDAKGNINKGYFNLMMKNFNYEINHCKDPSNFDKKKKKYKTQGSLVFMKDKSEFEGKNLLLVKEQVRKKAKEKEGKDGKKSKKKNEDTNVPSELNSNDSKIKTIVVFPEDIEHAVKKSDKSVMLYNGGRVYSAADGSVYVGPKPYTGPGPLYYIYTVVSLIATVVLFAFVIAN